MEFVGIGDNKEIFDVRQDSDGLWEVFCQGELVGDQAYGTLEEAIKVSEKLNAEKGEIMLEEKCCLNCKFYGALAEDSPVRDTYQGCCFQYTCVDHLAVPVKAPELKTCAVWVSVEARIRVNPETAKNIKDFKRKILDTKWVEEKVGSEKRWVWGPYKIVYFKASGIGGLEDFYYWVHEVRDSQDTCFALFPSLEEAKECCEKRCRK